ncbi:MAG: sodium:solute symporter family protein [Phycisphaerales bacterium]|nr:sodium:solute symporter family protein [Phycisphaerales bacterium]
MIDQHLHAIDWSILVVYMLGMMAIGGFLLTRISGFKQYFLADGMLTTPLLVCTLVSTYYELDVTFAVSEQGYYYGLVSWFWLSRPYYLCIIIGALLLAPRLKKFDCITLPDLLEQRYGKATRIAGAAACFIYSLPITALAGMTIMFTMLGWNKAEALLVSMGICAAYTAMGGLWADAISDTIQFVLMCVALAIAIPIALKWVGGFESFDVLPAEHMTATGGLRWGIILAWSVGALTIFVEPAFYQRIFAAKDSRSIIYAMLIGIALWAAYDWGVTVVGMIARVAVEKGMLAEDLEGKKALMAVCMQTLPIGLRGLFLGGVLAAAMSSTDTYSLLASGNLVYDIYRPLRRKPLTDRQLILLTRIGIFAVLLLASWMSLLFERITDAWVFMSGALASVVLVPALGAIFGRPPRLAGWLSTCSGLVVYAAYHTVVAIYGQYDEEYESVFWTVAGFDAWREYAVLFALPVSAAGFGVGHVLGRKEP